MHALYHSTMEAPLLQEAEKRQKQILDADYSKVDAQEYVDELDYLNTEEKDLLFRVLHSHPTLFGGGLGKLKIKPIHLEIKEDAKPYHSKYYPVPHVHEGTTKKECDRLASIDVLEKNSTSEWAAPSFIQPKKTGDVRVLTDFRRLKAVLKRKPELCRGYGMERKPSTSHNPQSNSIVERIHQVLGNMLRTYELEERELNLVDPFSSFLSAAAYAIWSTYHTTLEATPAELVFGRNMFLSEQFKADWVAIRARRQAQINKDNKRENSKRLPHTYRGKLPKLRRKRDGPLTITKVCANGTVNIRDGAVTERINIRRIQPYKE